MCSLTSGSAADWSRTTVEVVRKPTDQGGFAVHPTWWVDGRSPAWLTAHHRLVRV
jgi:hypothetical protein